MNVSSEYDDILGMLNRVDRNTPISPIETIVEETTMGTMPEPFTPSRESQALNEAITQFSNASISHSFGDMDEISPNELGETTALSQIDSLMAFVTIFIPEINPHSLDSFTIMLNGIKEHFPKDMTQDDQSDIGKQLGDDIKKIIDGYTSEWTSTLYDRVYKDNVINRRTSKTVARTIEDMKGAISTERAHRDMDRSEALKLMTFMKERITNLEIESSNIKPNIIRTKDRVLTRHEQQRAKHKDRYEVAMRELEKIAIGLQDTAAAIRHYSQMEIECSSKLHKNIELISLDSISQDTTNEPSISDDSLRILDTIQDRITNLGKVYESLTNCIRGVLSSNYTITENISSEKVLSLLTTKEFDLPRLLDGQPSPIIAQILISSIRSVLHSFPKQTWALHATLERTFVDTSKTSIHWSPIASTDPQFTWESLRDFYDNQNKALYELLERRSFNAVHKSFHTLITGDIDDRGTGANTRGSKNDAVGTIAWWIRYHTRSGFKDRQKIKDIFNHAFGPLGDADIQTTIDKLRKLIPSVRRLGIKLSYESVITQSVNVLQSRHPSFISSLEEFKRIPDERFEDDAIDAIDAFLSRVERIVQTIHHTVPRTRTDDIDYARSIFDSGCSHLPMNLHIPDDTNPMVDTHHHETIHKAGPPTQVTPQVHHIDMTCKGRGCNKPIEKFVLERLGLEMPGEHTLCRECYLQLHRKESSNRFFKDGTYLKGGGRAAVAVLSQLGMIPTSHRKTQRNVEKNRGDLSRTNQPFGNYRGDQSRGRGTRETQRRFRANAIKPIGMQNETTPKTTKEPKTGPHLSERTQSHDETLDEPREFKDGVGSLFTHTSLRASGKLGTHVIPTGATYDATFTSKKGEEGHTARASRDTNTQGEPCIETPWEDPTQSEEDILSEGTSYVIPIELSEQVRTAMNEGIDEVHQCIDEMERAGWTRDENAPCMSIHELHENINDHVRGGWTLATNTANIPIEAPCPQNQENSQSPHQPHERQISAIKDENDFDKGYTITEPDGSQNTITLQPCSHTKCQRYCDDYNWAKYCDFCAVQEGTPKWSTTSCDECSRPRDEASPEISEEEDDIEGDNFDDTICHEVLSQSESENEMRQAFARSIIEHIEREDGDNETKFSPTELSEAYSTDAPPNLGPGHQLTWCQGELWEGGCPHSNMEPEPITDESGQVKGWVSFNHDGTTSTTHLPICKHTKCTRYCDRDNGSTTCPSCA